MTEPRRTSRTEPSPTLADRIRAHPAIALLLLAGAVLGAVTLLLRPVVESIRERQAASPEAEYARLAQLRAGVSVDNFDEILGDSPDLRSSTNDDLQRNIYKRPYVYVLAVTNEDGTVVSFSVMVRQPDFKPELGGIVLGETVPSAAWDAPGALAGACGRPVQYFEVSQGPVTAAPVVHGIGLFDSGGVDQDLLEAVCQADTQLDTCDAYLAGGTEVGLSAEAVDCFLSSRPGQHLRSTLRPNVYASGMPFQELSYELIAIFQPELMALDG